jgi:hypothetical protein
VDALQPKQMLTYEVEVQALQPNDAHFHVELHSPDITDPVTVEESTTIYAPGAGPSAASLPPSPATQLEGGQPDSFKPATPSTSRTKPPPDWSTTTEDTSVPAKDRTGASWRLRR